MWPRPNPEHSGFYPRPCLRNKALHLYRGMVRWSAHNYDITSEMILDLTLPVFVCCTDNLTLTVKARRSWARQNANWCIPTPCNPLIPIRVGTSPKSSLKELTPQKKPEEAPSSLRTRRRRSSSRSVPSRAPLRPPSESARTPRAPTELSPRARLGLTENQTKGGATKRIVYESMRTQNTRHNTTSSALRSEIDSTLHPHCDVRSTAPCFRIAK